MAITLDDLQPKKFEVTIKGKKLMCSPPRVSHRLILNKLQPFFTAIVDTIENSKEIDISGEKLIEYEKELDLVFSSLIPELKNITLDIEDVAELLTQIIDASTPDEVNELKDNNIQVNSDPKVVATG